MRSFVLFFVDHENSSIRNLLMSDKRHKIYTYPHIYTLKRSQCFYRKFTILKYTSADSKA